MNDSRKNLRGLTAEIVAAYSRHNRSRGIELGSLIEMVHSTLASLAAPAAAAAPAARRIAAVPIRRSVAPDHLVCLDCGVRLKILKRHLRAVHELTPQQYRERWDLPTDYPIVAPIYAGERADHARGMGLGRRPDR